MDLLNPYYLQIVMFFIINAIMGISIYFTLASGQLSLGAAGFMSVGAYVGAMLSLNDATLVVPHPHFWDRSFVLEPLYELLPTFTYKDMTINERLAQLSE